MGVIPPVGSQETEFRHPAAKCGTKDNENLWPGSPVFRPGFRPRLNRLYARLVKGVRTGPAHPELIDLSLGASFAR